MRNESRTSGSGRGGEKPVAETRHGAYRLLLHLTYDVTRLVGDLVEDAEIHGQERLPPNRSQAGRWTEKVRTALPAWIGGSAIPVLQARLEAEGLSATLVQEDDKLFLKHAPVSELQAAYASADVLMEFGGRSSGLPAEPVRITCDAAAVLPDLAFPEATARAMDLHRTFWEKATAVHSFCTTRLLKAERLSRHWYDLRELALKGHAATALADRGLAGQVARHKTLFFAVKGVDYDKAVNGGLVLTPEGDFVDALRADYLAMQEGGLLNAAAPTFDELIAEIAALQDLANK